MLSFLNDYTEGAHEKVLESLVKFNRDPQPGYGDDLYSRRAAEKIAEFCGGGPGLQIRLLTGGTQTNQAVISSVLSRYQGVIAADTGHISVHEAGAIEYSGHKVIALPGKDGKLCPASVERYLENFYADPTYEHMVIPGMVYISHPTEYGTLYTKSELEELSKICRKYDMSLYMDGARLGYGLVSPEADVSIDDIVRLCDVFYIGGTKLGALCGEAVVFTHGNMPKGFVTMTKQQGAMLAKGRLLGIQFDALFSDGLYLEISRHAIDMAMELKKLFTDKGYELYIDSPTNQQFVILDDETIERLSKELSFGFWEKLPDGRSVMRFVTGWATKPQDIEQLARLL